MALSESVSDFHIRHIGDVRSRISQVAGVVKVCEGDFKKAVDVFNYMNESPVDAVQVIHFFEKVIPDLKKRDDKEIKRNIWKNMFDTLNQLFYYGKGNNGTTLWHAYNAVTEYADHYHGNNDVKRFTYSQFGSGYLLKVKAFEVAQNYVRPEIIYVSNN